MAHVVKNGTLQGGSGAPVYGSLDTTHAPVGLWLLDGDLTDSSGSGLTLTDQAGGASTAIAYMRVGGRSWAYFAGDEALNEATGAAATEILGDVTIQATVCFMVSPSADMRIVSFGGDDETSGENLAYSLCAGTLTAGAWTSHHEHTAGANEIDEWTDPDIGDLVGQFVHVALVRDVSGKSYDLYLNGMHVGQQTYTTDPDGADGAASVWIGAFPEALTGYLTKCLVGNVKIISGALTAAQCLAEAQKVIGPT